MAKKTSRVSVGKHGSKKTNRNEKTFNEYVRDLKNSKNKGKEGE